MPSEGWSLEEDEAPCTSGTAAPSLCPNNCGFFASPATMNLCSSCYQTLVPLNSSGPAQTPTPLEPEEPKIDFSLHDLATFPSSLEPASAPTSSTYPTAPAEAAAASASAVEASVCCEKAQSLRCFACQKKVGLRGFKCRCGVIFCALHRYPDKHSCSFDYRAVGRASIEKANPVVRAEKLHRI